MIGRRMECVQKDASPIEHFVRKNGDDFLSLSVRGCPLFAEEMMVDEPEEAPKMTIQIQVLGGLRGTRTPGDVVRTCAAFQSSAQTRCIFGPCSTWISVPH